MEMMDLISMVSWQKDDNSETHVMFELHKSFWNLINIAKSIVLRLQDYPNPITKTIWRFALILNPVFL